jgi:prepilin-type N-terminal cleavage/methylation domain-containing protein
LKLKNKQGGFTLLELLVVVAILASLAGALMVAYDGLGEKADSATASHSLAAIDQGVRTFRVVTKSYPNELDDLAVSATAGITLLGTEAREKFTGFQLSSDMVNSLTNAGVTRVRKIAAADNALITNTTATPAAVSNPETPNWVFNLPAAGGISGGALTGPLALASPAVAGTSTDIVSIVANDAAGATTCADTNTAFDTTVQTDAHRLTEMAGLRNDQCHVVVALGLGNNSTLISNEIGAHAAGFSEAPTYPKLGSREYARYLALFHVASDTTDPTGLLAADGIFSPNEVNGTAKFVGVIDTNGDPLDEELAESK